MTKTRNLCLAIIVLGSFAHSFAHSEEGEQEARTELETYAWLEFEGIFDEEIPNSEIHALISKGLKHDDPEIVHSTVGAMGIFLGVSSRVIEHGLTPRMDRRLQDIPDLYDTLIKMWDEGWAEAGGVIPVPIRPDDYAERVIEETGTMLPYPTWPALPMMLAYLFPVDEKVYEIIWEVFPIPPGGFRGGFPDGDGDDQNNPGPLLSALHLGKFNNPKDQQFRTDILLNTKTIRNFSSRAARSLGEFRSDEGFEALVTVLQNGKMKYGTPYIPIVEAMLKYEEPAVPYLSLMRERLASSPGLDSAERELKITLKERLVHFEEKYAEEAEQPER